MELVLSVSYLRQFISLLVYFITYIHVYNAPGQDRDQDTTHIWRHKQLTAPLLILYLHLLSLYYYYDKKTLPLRIFYTPNPWSPVSDLDFLNVSPRSLTPQT